MLERANKYLSPVLTHVTEVEIEKGKGCYLFGLDGKKYLDFASGIAVVNTGHCHPKVVKAAASQIKKLIHACAGIVYYSPNVDLAEKLAQITPAGLDVAFFCQSGTEAIEAGLKLAKYATKKPGIISFEKSFHGRTLGALSVTNSNPKYRENYEPLLPKVYTVPKQIEAVKKVLAENKDIAACIIEPIQCEGGYLFPEDGFLPALRKVCDENGVLLIFDEVQSGFGRTGYWFACQHYKVAPDILCLAKAIASGFPLGAIISTKALMDKWLPGAHGGTMSGNPVTCAAGLATLQVIEEENLMENAQQQGAYLKKKLEKLKKSHSEIKDVRGLGLMVAVEFDSKDKVKEIQKKCLAENLILISCGDGQVIRFIPPLIVKKKQINDALRIFQKALS